MVFNKIVFNVAGVTFENRQGKLWNLRKAELDKNRKQKVWLSLRREKTNMRDSNAIAVIAHVPGAKQPAFKIGYVPANIASWLAPRMDAGLMVRVYAKQNGAPFVHGGHGANLGVTIKVVYQLMDSELARVPLLAEED